jgi:hypothetical protein
MWHSVFLLKGRVSLQIEGTREQDAERNSSTSVRGKDGMVEKTPKLGALQHVLSKYSGNKTRDPEIIGSCSSHAGF